jgi:hypothetical protein
MPIGPPKQKPRAGVDIAPISVQRSCPQSNAYALQTLSTPAASLAGATAWGARGAAAVRDHQDRHDRADQRARPDPCPDPRALASAPSADRRTSRGPCPGETVRPGRRKARVASHRNPPDRPDRTSRHGDCDARRLRRRRRRSPPRRKQCRRRSPPTPQPGRAEKALLRTAAETGRRMAAGSGVRVPAGSQVRVLGSFLDNADAHAGHQTPCSSSRG